MTDCVHCPARDTGRLCADCASRGHTNPAKDCHQCKVERDQQTRENVKNYGGGWYAQKRQDTVTEKSCRPSK